MPTPGPPSPAATSADPAPTPRSGPIGSAGGYADYLPDGREAQRRLLDGVDVHVILDGGANDGGARRVYRRFWPEAIVWSFEPNPETFGRLRDRTPAAEHPHLVNAAIGAEEGEAALHLAEHSWADSLVRRPVAAAAGRAAGAVRVRLVSLDGFIAERGIERVDVLKLDVEGVECEALDGARRLLTDLRPRLIHCELNFKPRHSGQSRASQVIERLWDVDYRLFDLYSIQRPDPRLGIGWADGIFLPLEHHPAFASSPDA